MNYHEYFSRYNHSKCVISVSGNLYGVRCLCMHNCGVRIGVASLGPFMFLVFI